MHHLSRQQTTCSMPAWEWLQTHRICYLTEIPWSRRIYSGTNVMASTNSKQRIRMLHPHQRVLSLNKLHSSSKAKAQMRQPTTRHSWNSPWEKATEKQTGPSSWTRGRWSQWVVQKSVFHLKIHAPDPFKVWGLPTQPTLCWGSPQAAYKTTWWDVVLPLSSVLYLLLRKQLQLWVLLLQ